MHTEATVRNIQMIKNDEKDLVSVRSIMSIVEIIYREHVFFSILVNGSEFEMSGLN